MKQPHDPRRRERPAPSTGARGEARHSSDRRTGRDPLSWKGWPFLILAVHAALVLWGAASNSVTFDENFNLPSGVMIASSGNFRVSEVNPPLVKALCAIPVLAVGAAPPDPDAVLIGESGIVGESFMRANAGRYHSLFFLARAVVLLLSIALGLLIWRFAHRLYGSAAAVFALAVYAFFPETLAHAGLVTMDLATALGFLASAYAYWKFSRTGRWRDWGWLAISVAATSLVRFTSWSLLPMFALLAVIGRGAGWIRRPGRIALGLALLVPAVVVALDLAYVGKVSFDPIVTMGFTSRTFQSLQGSLPDLRLPLPVNYLAGFDHQLSENEGILPTYLLGRVYHSKVWYYFPLAILFKWPLGFFGLLATRLVQRLRDWKNRAAALDELHLVGPAALFMATLMLFGQLNAGVRYVFPVIPFLCVWMGGLLAPAGAKAVAGSRTMRNVALALASLLLVETAACAPWYLTFFNWPSGGPGRGDRLVNDSNVDWGQGLIALKKEMQRRGIRRVHLSYHGTADPAVYGIDYLPKTSGDPIPESEWLAVSSYYFVGLPQRMMTPQGRTDFLQIDYSPWWGTPPVARPANCMYLFRGSGSR